METNTVPPPLGAARPLTSHMTSAQLPHPPSQDLPDWVSGVSPIPSLPLNLPHSGCDWGTRTPPCLFWEPHIWISSCLGGGASALPIPLDPLSKGRARWC